jgi:predicted DNA-binding transcriptional regulator YafY
MPANKYALIRYRVIDRLISNKYKPYPGVEDLMDGYSEALGKDVSKSTIEKDLAAMKNDLGLGYEAPIKFSKEYQGYYYEDPDYSIEDIPLSTEEINAIRIAANTLYQFKNNGLFKQYDAAIDKILNKVKLSPEDNNQAAEVIQFEQAETVRGQEFLTDLFNAAMHRHKVSFHYLNYRTEDVSSRTLHPYLLKEYANRWYVIGLDEDKNDYRVFGLDRISDLVVSKDPFSRKKRFKPANYFKHSIGITAPAEEEPVEVILRCNALLTKYLESQPLHASQRITGNTVTLKVIPTYELNEKLIGFGNQVKVIAPPTLMEEVKHAHLAALKQYEE